MSKFKVLLVYPNLQMVTLLPNNIAILAAYLKEAGIEVRVFNTTFYKTTEKSIDDIRVEYMQIRPFNLKEKGVDYKNTDIYEDFIKLVEEYKPDLVGLSATEETYDLGVVLAAKIRQKRVHIIIGGVHPTICPEEVISNPNIDSLCVGEGEEALVELCLKMQAGKDITGIANLWIKEKGKIYKNGMRPLSDINRQPYDDFSVFDKEMFFRPMQGKIRKMIPVTISRGCPYSCSFCAAPFLRKLYSQAKCGAYFRTKTIARIIDELKYYIGKYGADYIYFNSETFFAQKDSDLREFAARYAQEIGLPFWCQTRIETISRKNIGLLKEMKCDRINIGLEHGNEEFRKKVLRKHFTNRQAIDALQIMEKSGIPFTINNMLGFPDETRELAFDTIKLNRQIRADAINAFVFVPYRGTPLREYSLKKGYLDPHSKTDTDIGNSILNMPQFSAAEIKGLERTFPLYVKMPQSYFDKIKIAEHLNPEGDAVLAELRKVYFKKYFN